MKIFSLIIIALLIISCQAQKDNDKSFEFYKKGLETLGTINSEGDLYYSDALNYFIKSINSNPNFIESRLWRMQCEINLGQFDAALLTSNSVLNEPKFKDNKFIPMFYLASGLLERIKGNIDNSIKCFTNALQIYELRIREDSKDWDAIINKATLLNYLGRNKEAIEFINSISLDNKNQNYINSFKESFSENELERVIGEMMKKKK